MAIQSQEVITSVKHRGYSVNGNPSFDVTFASGDTARTKGDSYVNYDIDNREFHDVPVLVTFDRAGRITHVERI